MKFIELINQSNFLKKRLENIDDIFKNSLIEGITNNSKKIKKNYIFFANIGEKTNGNIFIEEAKQNGATIIISSVETGKNIIKLPNIFLLVNFF